jgi:hypothetical protein
MRKMENKIDPEEIRNVYKISVGKTEGNHFTDISADGWTLLKCIQNTI